MWKKVLAKGIKKLWCTDMNVKLLGTQARPFAELFVFIHYVYFVTTLKLSISLHFLPIAYRRSKYLLPLYHSFTSLCFVL